MKRLFFLLLPIVIVLAACRGQDTAELSVEVAAPQAEATAPLALEATVPLPTDTSAPAVGVPTEAPTSRPVEEIAQEQPSAESVIEPDPTVALEPTVEVDDPDLVQVISGQTAEGAYFYGSPDAPVTLFDYSDFL